MTKQFENSSMSMGCNYFCTNNQNKSTISIKYRLGSVQMDYNIKNSCWATQICVTEKRHTAIRLGCKIKVDLAPSVMKNPN